MLQSPFRCSQILRHAASYPFFPCLSHLPLQWGRTAVPASAAITGVSSDGSCWDVALKTECFIKENRAQNENASMQATGSVFFSTSTCNRNIFWISSLQECLYILASLPGRNKNIFPDGIYTVWAVLKSCDQFY